MIIIVTTIAYFAVLFVLSRFAAARKDTNDAFYRGGRTSPWLVVAFGMIGASVSGVTFVSVPGMVTTIGMTYIQTCIGFIVGYFVVAFILLPLYYKLDLISIYEYLGRRFGTNAHLTGSWVFLATKTALATVRFYVVCVVLQRYVFDVAGMPFPVTVVSMIALIWLYTRRGGIRTIVWTDAFQTLCLLVAAALITVIVASRLGMDMPSAVRAIADSGMSRVFVFDDYVSTQNFWKQFVSGMFIVVVMTGLDQDMMQKNLSCRSLRAAQKNVCSYGFAFVPVNMLLLSLGILLVFLARQEGTPLPASPDELLPMYAATGHLGVTVTILFTIGVVAASFTSADSALTALTTIYCVDIRRQPDDVPLRRKTHLLICILFVALIIVFHAVNRTSVIDAIYTICSYTYGPLLGLFAFGMTTRRRADDRAIPFIAVASPVMCFVIDMVMRCAAGYKFGYELLILNGALTFAALYLSSLHTTGAARRSR